jgi:hypothetical protein
VGPDQFLCAACRDEHVRPAASRFAVQEAPGPVVPAGETWRGQPVPRGMILPSRTQYHGTMYALIAVGVAVTLTLAALVNGGIGPFVTTNARTVQTSDGPQAAATVHNQGEHAGRARCVATWTSAQGGLQQSGVVQTNLIQPGQSVAVMIPLVSLRTAPASVAIDCK